MKIVVLIIVALLSNVYALGCGCGLRTFTEAVADADEIFVGRVHKVEYIYFRTKAIEYDSVRKTLFETLGDEQSIRRVTFEVEKKWKGSNSRFVSIYDKISSCSFNFQEFDRYIVYAYKSKLFYGDDDFPDIIGFNTDFCSRTLPDPNRYPFSENIVIESFNDIPLLEQQFPNQIELIDFRIVYVFVVVVIILVLVVFILLYRRKHKAEKK